MRLINTTTLELEEFEGSDIPLYSILSHTWDEDEVTYQDIQAGKAEGKLGYKKIKYTCKRALADGFDHVWIDTCCIDKKSSAELSEAINSMCSWYQDAAVCYAYLADMPPVIPIQQLLSDIYFAQSRWFTRGWTLQELIMPQVVIFLNSHWQEIGTKASLRDLISSTTKIPVNVLRGDIDSANVAQKMSWASRRSTKRIEDHAYCLMGLFGIHMPLLYGEGEKAFIRLQEEIMKITDDHSIFAWRGFNTTGDLLATSPEFFVDCNDVEKMDQVTHSGRAMTVNSTAFHLRLHISKSPVEGKDYLALLPCEMSGKQIGIYLQPIPDQVDTFKRASRPFDLHLPLHHSTPWHYLERSICVRRSRLIKMAKSAIHDAAALGNKTVVSILISNSVDLETKNEDGETALALASKSGHLPIVRLLLDGGADPNAQNMRRETPLFGAVIKGHESVVEVLIEKGADMFHRSVSNIRLLDFAVLSGHPAVLKALLKARQELLGPYDRNFASCDGFGDPRTSLGLAALLHSEAMVQLLLPYSPNLEQHITSSENDPMTELVYLFYTRKIESSRLALD